METIPGRIVEVDDGPRASERALLAPPSHQCADLWVRFGQAVYEDHRLSPRPVAEAGLVETCVCTCGLPAAACDVRRLVDRLDLERSGDPGQWADTG
jgi:hypothetical protein